MTLPDIPTIDVSIWGLVRWIIGVWIRVRHPAASVFALGPTKVAAATPTPSETPYMNITSFLTEGSEVASLAFALPGALAALEAALPTMETEGKALWTAVYTPAKAFYTDVTFLVKGGTAAAASANAAKSVTDGSALFAALVAALPSAKADLSGLYTTLLPVFQPIADALGKTLPAAIFVPVTTPAAAAA